MVKHKEKAQKYLLKLGRFKSWLKPNNQHERLLAGAISWVGLIAIGVITIFIFSRPNYNLSKPALSLVNTPVKSLAKFVSYDSKSKTYYFYKDGIGQKQTSGTLLGSKTAAQYSLKLPTNLSQGITYYDNQSNLSFTLTPDFLTSPGKNVNGHFVYPGNKGVQYVYTVKGNGLTEDIVLNRSVGNSLTYSYNLALPNYLAARQVGNSIGIYSASPALFGNISYGTPADQQKVAEARFKSPKTNLVFLLAPPTVSPDQGSTSLSYKLSGNKILVSLANLNTAKSYPLDIDPTVIVNSGFTNGNNEGDITVANGSLTEGGLSGGGNSAGYTNSTTYYLPANIDPYWSVAFFNNYLYIVGGLSTQTVYFAVLNSSGGIASNNPFCGSVWCTTTSLPSPGGYNTPAIAYNGYIYKEQNNNQFNYININSNGSLGASWTSTTAATFSQGTLAVYNDTLYAVNQFDFGHCTNAHDEYAHILSNGSLSSWTTGPGEVNGAAFGAATAYNGYLYEWGGETNNGCSNTPSSVNTVSYAPLSSTGAIGTWVSSSKTIPVSTTGSCTAVGLDDFNYGVYDGYLYMIGGFSQCNNFSASLFSNATYFTQLNANGSLGDWQTGTAVSNSLQSGCTTKSTPESAGGNSVYNGYLYVVGGPMGNSSSCEEAVEFSPIDTPGSLGQENSTTNLPNAYTNISDIAYNGYVYIVGGCYSTCAASTSYVAAIGSNGALGSWSSTGTGLNAIRLGALVAYNGYIYYLGGFTGTQTNEVQYAPITPSSGAIGTWNTTTVLLHSVEFNAAVAYNGYMYEIGGNPGGTPLTEVDYAPINSNGSIGSWTATTNLPPGSGGAGYQDMGTVVYNGYIYVMGGFNSGGLPNNEIDYAKIDVSNGQLDITGPCSSVWCSTTNLVSSTNTLYNFLTFAVNGYLYVMGGKINGTTGQTANDYYAVINSDGTIGSFTQTTSLSVVSTEFGAGYSNGYVYTLGDSANNAANYFPLFNGGSGLNSSWSSTSTFAAGMPARGYAGTVAYNGYLYEIGGQTATSAGDCTASNGSSSYACNGTWYAQINSNGTIGSWSSTSTFAAGMPARYYLGAFAYNGYLYVLGGHAYSSSGDCTTGSSSSFYCNGTWYAQINSNGTIGSWTSTSNFAAGMPARSAPGVAAYNGYLYLMGGGTANSAGDCTNGSGSLFACNGTWYAQINSNGTIGSWTSTTTFPSAMTARSALQSFTYDGYIYSVGGNSPTSSGDCTIGSGTSYNCNGVWYAQINTNGTIGSWTATTGFSYPARYGMGVSADNGYVYVVGGSVVNNSYDCSTYCTGVWSAPIGTNGSIGNWSMGTQLSLGRSVAGTVIYNGNLYEVGGLAASSSSDCTANNDFCNGTYYSPLLSLDRVGNYSIAEDVTGLTNDTVTPDNIVVYGSDTGNLYINPAILDSKGGIVTATAIASDSCNTFSSEATTSAVVQYSQTVGFTSDGCSNATNQGRYVYFFISLDDSLTATFPDVNSNHTSVTGIYMYYHPNTGHRLRGGATFSNNLLQSLDTVP